MQPTEDGYVLSTGKAFRANCGILGLRVKDVRICHEGYDGSVLESHDRDVWMDEAEYPQSFTAHERREIADYMIALWNQFAG